MKLTLDVLLILIYIFPACTLFDKSNSSIFCYQWTLNLRENSHPHINTYTWSSKYINITVWGIGLWSGDITEFWHAKVISLLGFSD